jgi:hypothetical protein
MNTLLLFQLPKNNTLQNPNPKKRSSLEFLESISEEFEKFSSRI